MKCEGAYSRSPPHLDARPANAHVEAMLSEVKKRLAVFFPTLEPVQCQEKALQLLEWCERNNTSLLLPHQYENGLEQILDPPIWLFVKGDVQAMWRQPWLALVGTRHPSPYGLQAAHFFSRQILSAGLGLISGLARGIDIVAHTTSVLAARPTIAVLAHGLDRIYPAEHRAIASEILDVGGCLVSEYPPGITARPYHFPRRNRIISALSKGTLVIEAGLKSGSLITARHALDQNREVFVVPGPYHLPGFAGSHWLLQQGAKLTIGLQDILNELPEPPKQKAVLPVGLPVADSSGVARVLHVMQKQRVATLQGILEESGLDYANLAGALVQAKEQGWLVEEGPQRFVYVGQ